MIGFAVSRDEHVDRSFFVVVQIIKRGFVDVFWCVAIGERSHKVDIARLLGGEPTLVVVTGDRRRWHRLVVGQHSHVCRFYKFKLVTSHRIGECRQPERLIIMSERAKQLFERRVAPKQGVRTCLVPDCSTRPGTILATRNHRAWPVEQVRVKARRRCQAGKKSPRCIHDPNVDGISRCVTCGNKDCAGKVWVASLRPTRS